MDSSAAGREVQVHDPRAIMEGAFANGNFSISVMCLAEPGTWPCSVAKGYMQVNDARATREGPVADGLQRGGELQVHNACAYFEGPAADGLACGWELQLHDPRATNEGAGADRDDRVRSRGLRGRGRTRCRAPVLVTGCESERVYVVMLSVRACVRPFTANIGSIPIPMFFFSFFIPSHSISRISRTTLLCSLPPTWLEQKPAAAAARLRQTYELPLVSSCTRMPCQHAPHTYAACMAACVIYMLTPLCPLFVSPQHLLPNGIAVLRSTRRSISLPTV